MPLPDLISIVPPQAPVLARITVPGSKSITNRALILAALSEGETVLKGALWSEDTQVMVECLQELGFMVNVQGDPDEVCNRTITVYGKAGCVPPGGGARAPLELFVGNAGTAARFLTAFTCLGQGAYRLSGVPRMHERPQSALFQALRQLGYRIDAENDRLPAIIYGGGVQDGKCRVSIEESSQFASALLLCAKAGHWQVQIDGENAEESPYVRMTAEMIKSFPCAGGLFQIEPDASSGSYFFAADWLLKEPECAKHDQASVTVLHWPSSGWQVDAAFPFLLRSIPAFSRGLIPSEPQQVSLVDQCPGLGPVRTDAVSRARDLGDSIMTAIVLAPFAAGPIRFTELGRLRHQECERVLALRTELTKCGARVIEEADSLVIYPSVLHGAEIETYNDHRMAMCFACLGLKVHGIQIRNPACVKKTFPDFFQKLAQAPPEGIGAKIRGFGRNQDLAIEDLFAV